jgi:hypothetical protein
MPSSMNVTCECFPERVAVSRITSFWTCFRAEKRLTLERDRLIGEATVAADRERRQEKVRESSESLMRKASELEARMWARLAELDRQESMSTKPPGWLPQHWLSHCRRWGPVCRRTHRPERWRPRRWSGGAWMLARRRSALSRNPIEHEFWNPGFDILLEWPATTPSGSR